MILLNRLKEINIENQLNGKTFLEVVCVDGDVIRGYYRGYTSALDNEPEIAELDIMTTYGQYTGIYETEIKEIKVIENVI